MNALKHYARFGCREGRRPCERFDSDWYRARYLVSYPDVDPLQFHLEFGSALGLSVNSADDLSRITPPLAEKRSLKFINKDDRGPADTAVPAKPRSDSLTVSVRGQPRQLSGEITVVLEKLGRDTFVRSVADAKCLPISRVNGKRTARPNVPTIVVCSHIAGQQKFGAERSFIDILDGVSSFPAKIVVTAPQNDPEYTAALIERANEVAIFSYTWWRNAAIPPANEVATFIDLLRSVRASAVHVNTIVLRAPMVASRLEGIPVICHVREIIQHDDALLNLIGLPAREVRRTVHEAADWIVANSNATGSSLWKAGRTVVIPNTVDVESFNLANEVHGGIVRFGLISSNLPKKGLDDFIGLAAEVSDRAPNAKFLMIGQDNEHIAQLKAEQRKGSVPGNVEFVDYQRDPASAIAMVNVVVNFSIFAESFGRTVLEGMAARQTSDCLRLGCSSRAC